MFSGCTVLPVTTHMHGLAVYVKEDLPFTWYLKKTLWIPMFLTDVLDSVPSFFFLNRPPFLFVCPVFLFHLASQCALGYHPPPPPQKHPPLFHQFPPTEICKLSKLHLFRQFPPIYWFFMTPP